MKISWKHANNGVRHVLQRDHLSDDISPPPQALLPRVVAQQDSTCSPRFVLASAKVPPDNRSNPQRAEESRTHYCAFRNLNTCRSLQQESVVIVCFQLAESGVEPLPVEVVEIRQMKARTAGRAFKHRDTP